MQRRNERRTADLAREKLAEDKLKLKAAKTIAKKKRPKGDDVDMSAKGTKKKSIRVRRKLVVKGIKIKTSDDKKRVREMLKDGSTNVMDMS
eukprot:CAMPEP_0198203186 /NCGR_PEP_ID=MMETSP1445-20131203/6431_1 /TAXON_ID=36898 /ORGANISM="Pyramimonas sp., Strain CCMP2087" /LENGTH=90 /DNA_ID=CAMNT_0043874447 /DNA_START=117 /DNA_END=389 /DNA_ORIENTATION=-